MKEVETKGKKKDLNKMKIKDLLKEKERISETIQKLKTNCNHRKKDRLNLKEFENSDVVCKRCGTKFNLKIIDERDLAKSILTIHNMLNQMLLYAKEDKDINNIRLFGQIDANLPKIADTYSKVVLNKGKKKKKNKKNKKRANIYMGRSPF